MSDVESWPQWTASILCVKPLSALPMQVGSRVRIHQPKLPPAVWRVVDLTPGTGFTWVNAAPGLRVTARHTVEPINTDTRVTLSIHYEGFLGSLLARFVGKLNDRYLAMEADGLKARCLTSRPNILNGQ